ACPGSCRGVPGTDRHGPSVRRLAVGAVSPHIALSDFPDDSPSVREFPLAFLGPRDRVALREMLQLRFEVVGVRVELRNQFALGYELTQKGQRSEEHTSELQSRGHLVCRLLLEKKKKKI